MTTASPPEPLLLPAAGILPPVPVPFVDPYDIPELLDERLLFDVLLPHCPPDIRYDIAAAPAPHWTLELEMWYDTFKATVWTSLYDDHLADEAWLVDAGAICPSSLRRALPVDSKEEWSEMDVDERAYAEVWLRHKMRFYRLAALDWMRVMFLIEHEKQRGHPVSEEELAKILAFASAQPLIPSAPSFSVWPFPTVSPPAESLTVVSDANLYQYKVPALPGLVQDTTQVLPAGSCSTAIARSETGALHRRGFHAY